MFKTITNLYQICFRNNENNNDSELKCQELIRNAFKGWSAAIPNMIVELETNNDQFSQLPTYQDGLINWDKLRHLSDRSFVMYRIQNQRYNFYPVSQIQKVINKGPTLTEKELEIIIHNRIPNEDLIDE